MAVENRNSWYERGAASLIGPQFFQFGWVDSKKLPCETIRKGFYHTAKYHP
jgi:hypothetical protein